MVNEGGVVEPTAEREFREYVASRQRSLYKVALLLTGEHHQAEDLLQSALVKVAQHWQRVSRAENLDAYVRRIIYHEQAGWWRRRKLRERSTDQPPDRPAPGDLAANVALRLRLRQALAGLSGQQRAAVVLRYYEDLSEQEVAVIMGCSVGTVRSHNARGLAKLRHACPDLTVPTVPTVPAPEEVAL
jgi:RNA polymerase sigma-70 factor (sigma-E family)